MRVEAMTVNDPITTSVQARVGTILAGKYRIVRVLGTGGMGAVFEAVNTWTERRVAIKLMIGPRVDDADLAARFLREARAASKIEHANVVSVLDMGQDPADGTLYIVQEFLDGRDLRSVLDDRSRLGAREAYEYLLPVMAGLIAAHDRGIIHRDLKPENVFIVRTPNGIEPKLIDFGLAKVKDQGRSDMGLSRTGETMGTPYYMSPEQARGERTIDAQTDVWAMGAVWFEVLSGRCPFLGESYNELLAKILMDEAPPLASLAPPLPAGLADVIQRSLQRDRSVRYPTMRAFVRALLDDVRVVQGGWHQELGRSYVRLVGSNAYDDAHTAVVVRPGSDIGTDDTVAVSLPPPDPLVATVMPAAGVPVATPMTASPPVAARSDAMFAAPSSSPAPSGIGRIKGIAILAVLGIAAALVAYRFARTEAPHVERPAVAASQPAPSIELAVETDPPNAAVSLDGTLIGAGVVRRTMVDDGRDHTLTARADGYVPYQLSFRSVPPRGLVRLERLPVAQPQTVAPDAGSVSANSAAAPSTTTRVPQHRVQQPASSGSHVLRPRSEYP